jgi:hypothetical protein
VGMTAARRLNEARERALRPWLATIAQFQRRFEC